MPRDTFHRAEKPQVSLEAPVEMNKLPLKEFIKTTTIGNKTNKDARIRKNVIKVFEVLPDFISFQSPCFL